MNDEARMKLVKDMCQEFVDKGSADLLFQHLADDVTWRATAPAGTPLHERFTGPAGVAEYFRRAHEMLSLEGAVVTDHLQSGDKIVVLGSERMRLRRTGQAQDADWAMVVSFARDRIADVLVIEDLSILLGA